MPDLVTTIVEEFGKEHVKYQECKKKIDTLIQELLESKGTKFHKLESRVKDIESLKKKIIRKGDKYQKLVDVTDLIGFRIITLYEDEVDTIAEMIKCEFEFDPENSIDKRQLEVDRFGYRSLHYVVSISEERLKLSEYSKYRGIKMEFQMRSVLQHAWAEIEHDLGYKSENAVPQKIRRSFNRIAAVLEMADVGFGEIKNSISEYKSEISRGFGPEPNNIDLNFESLSHFIATNSIIAGLDSMMGSEFGAVVSSNSLDPNFFLNLLKEFKIVTIGQLEQALEDHQEIIREFFKIWAGGQKSPIISPGLSILYLFYVLIGEENDLELANSLTYLYMRQTTGERILSTYKKAKEQVS